MADSHTAQTNPGAAEFDEAIAGKGPKMPRSSLSKAEQAALDKALADTFPASDPVAPSMPETGAGAPKGRRSAG